MDHSKDHKAYLPAVAVVLSGVDDALLAVGGVLRVAALPVGVVHRSPVQPVEALRVRVAPTQTDPLLGVVGDPEKQQIDSNSFGCIPNFSTLSSLFLIDIRSFVTSLNPFLFLSLKSRSILLLFECQQFTKGVDVQID